MRVDPVNLDEHIRLWNIASIKVLDIRHSSLKQEEELRFRSLPASCFLCAVRGSAHIALSGEEYVAEGFHVLHGGKGLSLEIVPRDGEFEYYMIFYKAKPPERARREIVVMMERNRPFHLHYGFVPNHPLLLFNKLEEMMLAWLQPGALSQFQVKASFYQFVSHQLRQLQEQSVNPQKSDLVAQAVRYIHEYYAEQITLESLADDLNYSASHLSIQFKSKMGLSPIGYLIRVRISRAAELLLTTDATLHDIASGIGYADVNYFSRIFKKEKGISPGKFRLTAANGIEVKDSAALSQRSSIVSRRPRSYIDNDNRYPFWGEGNSAMPRTAKASTFAILLMCMTIMLGACSNGPSNSANADRSSQPPANASSAISETPASTAASEAPATTKIVKNVFGDVEIPMEPKQIASVGLEDMLLSLDAPLVQAGGIAGGYLYDALVERNIPVVEFKETINYEAILSVNPDLILIIDGYADEASYKQLSQIAPTLVYSRDDWKNAILEIGKAINREDKANEILQAYNDKLQQSREKIVQAIGDDKTVALLRPAEKEVDLFFPTFAYGGVLYNDLGLTASPGVAAYQEKTEEDWGYTMSLEMLGDMDPDYLFVTAGYSLSAESDYQSALETAKGVEKLQVWQSIPAVKANQVHRVSARHWMLSGPIADSMKIDDVVKELTGGQ